MNAIEARRIARQKKILSNQESRLNRILDKAQTVEGNATLESYYESQNFSTPPKDLEPILEPILFPEIKTVPLNVSQSIKEEKLVPEIEKEETLNTKDNKVFIQQKVQAKDQDAKIAKDKSLPFILWLIFGIAVRLILKSPGASVMIFDNAFAPFLVSYSGAYLLNPLNSTGDANTILKYLTLGLQLLGVRQVVRNRLQCLLTISLDLAEKFSIYFVGFIVCSLVLSEWKWGAEMEDPSSVAGRPFDPNRIDMMLLNLQGWGP